MQSGKSIIVIVASLILANRFALGDEIEVVPFQVGAFYGAYTPADEAPPFYPTTIAPDNLPGFQNYYMGRSSSSPLSSGFTTPERRPFFIYPMADVTIPVGHYIESVTIELNLLPGGTSALANFTDDREIIGFTGTSVPTPELTDLTNTETENLLIWDSFGTGTPYGEFIIHGIDAMLPNVPTPPDLYAIPLPGALPDLELAILTGTPFVVTSRLLSFDPGPIGVTAPPPIDPYEYVFGSTDVVAPGPTIDPPLLSIMTSPIPEPAAISIVAAASVLGLRRRKNMHK